jgi:hydrogenase-4 component E
LPQASDTALLLPTAITLLAAGMFLLMARRNAIAMVLGYIMMENGIYLVGTSFSVRAHHIVEFGILLDVLAGVMIMAIILQNIKQAFDDVDTALLRTLKGIGESMVEIVFLAPLLTGILAFFCRGHRTAAAGDDRVHCT